MKFTVFLTTVLTVVSTTLASPINSKRDDLLPPSKDDFYKPPSGWESKPKGTILKQRNTPGPPGILKLIKLNLAGSYQFMYTSTDSHGNASWAVTTVLVPYNADGGKLLSYQTAEDAAFFDCSPSYALLADSKGGLSTQVEVAAMAAGLDQGWIVVTADYEGPKSAFTAGIQAGHAVLDSVRAVLQTEETTGIKKDAQVQFWGYSGGSLASNWALELQPTYYSDLNVVGAAVGGLVPKIDEVVKAVNKGPFVGLVPAGIMGLAHEYPSIQKVLDEQFVPEKRDAFVKAEQQCLIDDITQYIFQDMWSYFKAGEGLLELPPVAEVLKENTQGQHAPKVPLFWYHSLLDEIAPDGAVDELYDNFCSQGVVIQYDKDLLSEHGTEMVFGVPSALSWLKDRFDGKPAPTTCKKTQSLNNALDPDAIKILGPTIFNLLVDLLGDPIGPDTLY